MRRRLVELRKDVFIPVARIQLHFGVCIQALAGANVGQAQLLKLEREANEVATMLGRPQDAPPCPCPQGTALARHAIPRLLQVNL